MDGALGVDPVEPDPNRLELATLGGATDRLRVQAQQLRELACLVVPLDHRLVSRVRPNGKLTSTAALPRAIIAKVRALLDMRVLE
jgi:hypothetical protein